MFIFFNLIWFYLSVDVYLFNSIIFIRQCLSFSIWFDYIYPSMLINVYKYKYLNLGLFSSIWLCLSVNVYLRWKCSIFNITTTAQGTKAPRTFCLWKAENVLTYISRLKMFENVSKLKMFKVENVQGWKCFDIFQSFPHHLSRVFAMQWWG